MAILCRISIFLFLIFCKVGNKGKQQKLEDNGDRCERLRGSPLFYAFLVVHKRWRVFHMWQRDKLKECISGDIYFTDITQEFIRRMKINMHGHLQQEPEWTSASLLLTTAKNGHEIALLVDRYPGSFIGVPNLIRDEPILPIPDKLPLKMYQMKLLIDSYALALVDCVSGTVWLLGHPNVPPSTDLVSEFVTKLGLTRGAKCSY